MSRQIQKCSWVCIPGLAYTQVCPNSTCWEDLKAMTPSSNDKPSLQILVSKQHSPIKGTRVTWREVFGSRTRAGKVLEEPRTSCGARKLRKCSKTERGMPKGHPGQPGGPPNGQGWNNLSKEIIVLDYTPQNKINIHWINGRGRTAFSYRRILIKKYKSKEGNKKSSLGKYCSNCCT